MTFVDLLKQRYVALSALSQSFNIEIDKTRKLLTDLMDAQEVIADGTVYRPNYKPILQIQTEELLDQVTTDQVSLFDIIEKSDLSEEEKKKINDFWCEEQKFTGVSKGIIVEG